MSAGPYTVKCWGEVKYPFLIDASTSLIGIESQIESLATALEFWQGRCFLRPHCSRRPVTIPISRCGPKIDPSVSSGRRYPLLFEMSIGFGTHYCLTASPVISSWVALFSWSSSLLFGSEFRLIKLTFRQLVTLFISSRNNFRPQTG